MLDYDSDSDSDNYFGIPSFNRQLLIDSYNYVQWQNRMRTHLIIFRFQSAFKTSRTWDNPSASVKKPIESDLAELNINENIAAEAAKIKLSDRDDRIERHQAEQRSRQAQGIIWSGLSKQVKRDHPKLLSLPSSAALWDYLHDKYGTPDSWAITRAHEILFPRRKWQDTEDILAHICQQRVAARVLQAAGMSLSERFLHTTYLQYVPASYYLQNPKLFHLKHQKDDCKFEEITKEVRFTMEWCFKPKKTQTWCYHHGTGPHDVSECRVVRNLWRDIRRLANENENNRREEEKAISAIFDKSEPFWYCDECDTREHDDKWCVTQLRQTLARHQ